MTPHFAKPGLVPHTSHSKFRNAIAKLVAGGCMAASPASSEELQGQLRARSEERTPQALAEADKHPHLGAWPWAYQIAWLSSQSLDT